MPELPEVERARKLIAETCTGYVIDQVNTVVDTIVYAGADHQEFANELTGRTVTGCERYGKQFWITLSGNGRFPLLHFGMTGMIQLRGQEPTWYRRKVNLGETTDSWPPKFCKFIIKLSSADKTQELAFIDPRRLGRLRLVASPVLSYPPLSELGFDPVLSHPTLDEFKLLLGKKKGTIKGVIMDQAFSAGVGNWVADEVLYQARIHPLHPVPLLDETQLADLHRLLREVPTKAIAVNADSSLFPPDWLFRFRWDKGKSKKANGKGKKKAAEEKEEEVKEEGVEEGDNGGPKFLALPDGRPATITFVTVAGRTSAVVAELQKMPDGAKAAAAKPTGKAKAAAAPKAKAVARKRKAKDESSDDSDSSLSSDPNSADTKPKIKVEVVATATSSGRAARAAARAANAGASSGDAAARKRRK